MTKHSASPWSVIPDYHYEEKYIKGYNIIDVNGGEIVGCEGIYGDTPEHEANARLMAVAPEMKDVMMMVKPLLQRMLEAEPSGDVGIVLGLIEWIEQRQQMPLPGPDDEYEV